MKNLILLPTYLGAFLGFLSFIFLGAAPGMLYGGSMGLVMAAAILGTPVPSTAFAAFIVGGGMALGLVAALFFFTVMGSLIGTIVGWPFIPFLDRQKKEEKDEVKVRMSLGS